MRLFRLGLMAVILAACLGRAPASAQIREGSYGIEGSNPDGSNYTGQFVLQPGPGGSWLGIWQVGNARLVGIGLIEGGVLAIGFVAEGRPGVAAYQVETDGKLRGTWTTGGGSGSELLTPR